MKKSMLFIAMMAICVFSANAQFGKVKIDKKHVEAATKGVKALTLSDAEIEQYCQEYVEWMDAHNPVCDDSDPGMKEYADRLTKIVSGIDGQSVNGVKLDIKAYYVVNQNAFACANGSIRVFAGLMDIMTDDQILGVVGHEIGHIANKDSKDAFKTALLTSALKDVVSSTGASAAALTDSQLGALGEALANAQYSQKQEYAADDYGYNFLKEKGKDPGAMGAALAELQRITEDSKIDRSKMQQLLSTHPDLSKRVKRLAEKK